MLLNHSAGCGRTGTIIALYSIIESIEYQIDNRLALQDMQVPDHYYVEPEGGERVSIFGIVRRLREQRWNMVKNAEQYKYVYTFAREWIKINSNLF